MPKAGSFFPPDKGLQIDYNAKCKSEKLIAKNIGPYQSYLIFRWNVFAQYKSFSFIIFTAFLP